MEGCKQVGQPRSTDWWLGWHFKYALMAELADAYDLGSYIERCAGSSPVKGTNNSESVICIIPSLLQLAKQSSIEKLYVA